MNKAGAYGPPEARGGVWVHADQYRGEGLVHSQDVQLCRQWLQCYSEIELSRATQIRPAGGRGPVYTRSW